jgi:hypothetical protein
MNARNFTFSIFSQKIDSHITYFYWRYEGVARALARVWGGFCGFFWVNFCEKFL